MLYKRRRKPNPAAFAVTFFYLFSGSILSLSHLSFSMQLSQLLQEPHPPMPLFLWPAIYDTAASARQTIRSRIITLRRFICHLLISCSSKQHSNECHTIRDDPCDYTLEYHDSRSPFPAQLPFHRGDCRDTRCVQKCKHKEYKSRKWFE